MEKEKTRLFNNKRAAEKFAEEVGGTIKRESLESVGLDGRAPDYIVTYKEKQEKKLSGNPLEDIKQANKKAESANKEPSATPKKEER